MKETRSLEEYHGPIGIRASVDSINALLALKKEISGVQRKAERAISSVATVRDDIVSKKEFTLGLDGKADTNWVAQLHKTSRSRIVKVSHILKERHYLFSSKSP